MSSYNEIALGLAYLMSVLSTDSTLLSLAPGGVHRALAPNGTATPHVIIAYQAGHYVTNFNGFRLFFDGTFQAKAVGPAADMAAITAAAARIDRLLGGPPGGPVSGPIVIGGVTVGNMDSLYAEQPLHIDEEVNGEVFTSEGALYNALIQQIAS